MLSIAKHPQSNSCSDTPSIGPVPTHPGHHKNLTPKNAARYTVSLRCGRTLPRSGVNIQKLCAQQWTQCMFQLCPRKPILSAMQQEPSWEGAQRPPGALARRRPMNKSALYQLFKQFGTNWNMTWLHRNSSFKCNVCVCVRHPVCHSQIL